MKFGLASLERVYQRYQLMCCLYLSQLEWKT